MALTFVLVTTVILRKCVQLAILALVLILVLLMNEWFLMLLIPLFYLFGKETVLL